MAGKIVTVIPRTSFSISGAASTSTLVRVGPRAISTIDWVSSVLVVRLHSKSFASSTATVQVSVVNVSLTSDAPGVLFLPPGTLVSSRFRTRMRRLSCMKRR